VEAIERPRPKIASISFLFFISGWLEGALGMQRGVSSRKYFIEKLA